MQRKLNNRMTPYYFLVPAVLGILALYAYPIIASLINSFLNYNLSRSPDATFNGFDNFIRLFQDAVFKVVVRILWFMSSYRSFFNLCLV